MNQHHEHPKADHDAEGFCRIRFDEFNNACKRFFRSRNMPDSGCEYTECYSRKRKKKKPNRK